MKKIPRKLLKDDAVPTLFDHNKGKQAQQRTSSTKREEIKAKRQLCEDALIHQEEVNSFEFQCNTKETRTECLDTDIKIDSITKVDFGVQCCIEEINE